MRPFAPIVTEIQQSVQAGQLDRVGMLLDQLETQLQAVAPKPSTAVSAACPVTPAALTVHEGTPPTAGGNTEAQFVTEIKNNPDYLRLVTVRAPKVAADGAVGRNIAGFADAAAQRDTIWLVLRGLATGSADDIQATVRSMAYAFEHQAPAGNFANNHGVSDVKAVGADAFFLQAFGRIYLLIAESQFRDCGLPLLDALKPKLDRAMRWLASNTDELMRQDHLATNCLFFDAVAFDLNGKILNDPSLRQIGKTFARAGLSNQRSDGTFNEHDGADSSYQAVSILNITGLMAHEDDPELRAQYKEAIRRGIAWERTRILPDGEVAVEGNSRTGLGQEEFMGKKKEVNYPEVALAMLYASIIEDDPSLRAQGVSIINYLGRRLHLWPSRND